MYASLSSTVFIELRWISYLVSDREDVLVSNAPGFDDPRTLRLVWPQWQGAGRDNIQALLPEVPYERARRG